MSLNSHKNYLHTFWQEAKIGDLQVLNKRAVKGYSDFYGVLSESHDVWRN